MSSSSDINADKLAQLRRAIPSYRPPSGLSSLPSSASFANAPSQSQSSSNSKTNSGGTIEDDDLFSSEREMFTSINGKKATPTTISGTIPSQQSLTTKSTTSYSSNNSVNTIATTNNPSVNNLQQSIVGRLATLEAAQRNLRSELVHREREVLSLRNELEAAKSDAKAARSVIASMEDEASVSNNSTKEPSINRIGYVRKDRLAQVDEIANFREEILALKEENSQLKQTAKEFEAFLLDYGLVWVGGSSTTPLRNDTVIGGKNATINPQSRKNSDVVEDTSLYNKIDFPVLILKLRQLSALAGEGKGGVIVSKNGAHQLEKRPSVPITLYKDGFLIFRGPFRTWLEEDSEIFLSDILDGYFPNEFKDSHPEGVIFDINDMSSKFYSSTSFSNISSEKPGHVIDSSGNENGTSSTSFSAFSGQGRSLNSSHPPRPTSAAAAKLDGRVFSLATIGGPTLSISSEKSQQGSIEPMSAKNLISSLPDKIITKEGDIVKVKEDIANLLGVATNSSSVITTVGNKSGVNSVTGGSTSSAAAPAGILVETSVLADMRRMTQEALIEGEGDNAPLSPPYEVATIQIRISGKENSTLIFKMRFDETIGDLRQYLDKHRGNEVSIKTYELRSSYPPSAFTDLTATMKTAGLTPNATIMYRHLAS